MKTVLSILFLMAFALSPAAGWAKDKDEKPKAKSKSSGTTIEFVSTGEGEQNLYGTGEADDPYKGKKVTDRDEAGHPLTQQSYDEDCTDDRCVRAKKRQLGEGDWRGDVDKGLRKPYQGTTKSDEPAVEE